jgi:hypothetical protein
MRKHHYFHAVFYLSNLNMIFQNRPSFEKELYPSGNIEIFTFGIVRYLQKAIKLSDLPITLVRLFLHI